MKKDNAVSAQALTLVAPGIEPTPVEAILPTYLGDPSSLWPMAILRFHRCARASARISVLSSLPSGAMIDLRRRRWGGGRRAVGFRCRRPLTSLLWACGPVVQNRSVTGIVKMRVCDRAPDLFQLAQLHDVDPAIFTNGSMRSSALSPSWACQQTRFALLSRLRGRDKREHCANACRGAVSRPCCTELPATVVTIWNVLRSCCVLWQRTAQIATALTL
jgi:hypothetical protein